MISAVKMWAGGAENVRGFWFLGHAQEGVRQVTLFASDFPCNRAGSRYDK
jgi:hypothetical protein